MSTLAVEERNERGEWSRLSAPGAAVSIQMEQDYVGQPPNK